MILVLVFFGILWRRRCGYGFVRGVFVRGQLGCCSFDFRVVGVFGFFGFVFLGLIFLVFFVINCIFFFRFDQSFLLGYRRFVRLLMVVFVFFIQRRLLLYYFYFVFEIGIWENSWLFQCFYLFGNKERFLFGKTQVFNRWIVRSY